MGDRATIVAATLAVPWTLIAFRLWVAPTPTGTAPALRRATYLLAFGLTAAAIYGCIA
jgi:hypothetical protein